MDPTLQKLVDDWLRLDRDPDTRAELQHLVGGNDTVELEKRLRRRIAFGTAGLRATMGAGFSRMNSLTVIQASQGLAAYLLKHESACNTRGVVIGRDARFNSDKFAKLAAAAFVAKGIPVKWLGQVHTPLVPYTVNRLGAVAGIMVTASHNPAADNGYKVYWSNACQIIPPHDVGIAQSIAESLEPLSWSIPTIDEDPLVRDWLPEVESHYLETAAANASIANPDNSVSFVYTPMHGVGLPFFEQALRNMGVGFHEKMYVVKDQAHPDPTFPTVRFPNPEEKGALDLAKKTADENGINLILANDPDADRFAAAEKVDGAWRQLTGNQIGVLLASHVLETYKPSKAKGLAMLSSTVSSKMLARMAAVEGTFHWEETLTGFKWLGNRARQLDEQGYDALFAYEEAIGYMFSNVVFDKDGVAAAAVFLAACNRWNDQGLSPWGKYDELCKRYGYFEDANTYVISPSADVTNRVFDQIRRLKPGRVGRRSIQRWRDLTVGFDSQTPDNRPTLPVDKSSQMISCELEGGVHFTVRGSGTEPKVKFYIEGSASTSQEAKAVANEVLEDLMLEWFKLEENGLKREGAN